MVVELCRQHSLLLPSSFLFVFYVEGGKRRQWMVGEPIDDGKRVNEWFRVV